MTAKNKPNEKQIFIYGLHTNKDETIRYVGKTTTLKKRLYEHINMSKRSKNHKNSWIKKHIDNGETIEIKIIEICKEKVKEFYPEIQSKTQWEKYFLGNKDKP